MTFLLALHSGIRWIVLGIALITAAWFVLVFLGRAKTERYDRLLMLVFTIALDIQVMVGILRAIELAVQNNFYGPLIGHILVMLLALGVGHMTAAFKKLDRKTRARNNLIAIAVVAVLIVVGVLSLPNGANRWGFRS